MKVEQAMLEFDELKSEALIASARPLSREKPQYMSNVIDLWGSKSPPSLVI